MCSLRLPVQYVARPTNHKPTRQVWSTKASKPKGPRLSNDSSEIRHIRYSVQDWFNRLPPADSSTAAAGDLQPGIHGGRINLSSLELHLYRQPLQMLLFIEVAQDPVAPRNWILELVGSRTAPKNGHHTHIKFKFLKRLWMEDEDESCCFVK
jgi:hypothetical protein